MPKQALLIVDPQNDFCPGGALAVPDGDTIFALINKLAADFQAQGQLVLATRDFHPSGHVSFASAHPGAKVGDIISVGQSEQLLWPDHCVQGSWGAAFHPALAHQYIGRIFAKGTNPNIDSYSGFFDNDHQSATGLGTYLHEAAIEKLTIVGLATDYCVLATARDALAEGFQITVWAQACRAVDVNPKDGERALADLAAAGAEIIY